MNHDFDARNALIDRAVRDVSTRAQRDHFSRMASLNPLADVETCWPTMVPAIRRRFAQLAAIGNMRRRANLVTNYPTAGTSFEPRGDGCG